MNILFKFENLILAGLASSAIGVAISYSDFYLFHLFIILLLLFWVIKEKEDSSLFSLNIGSTNSTLFFLLFFIWYLISLTWTQDITLGIKYLFYIFCGIIISLMIIHFSTSINKFNSIYKTIRFIFLLELIVSLFESFTLFRWPISPYSSFHSFFGKESSDLILYNQLSSTLFNPPTGFHWNTNNLALTMLLILPFFLCYHKLVVKFIGLVSITLIIVLSASRAVFLGLIFVFCFYMILIKKKVGTLFFIFISTITIFWGMYTLSDSENPRLNEVANTIIAVELFLKGDIDVGGSIEWRRQLINDGILALKESNGLGIGAGGATALQESKGGVAGRFTSMHNFWVEVLVEGGVIFSLLGLIWYLNILYNLFIVSNSQKSSYLVFYSKALLLSMIAFIPGSISASSTIYFFPMWIMFGMAISVISLYRKEN